MNKIVLGAEVDRIRKKQLAESKIIRQEKIEL